MSGIPPPYKKHTPEIWIGVIILILAIGLLIGLAAYQIVYVTGDVAPNAIGCSGSSYTACNGGGLLLAELLYIVILVIAVWMITKYHAADEASSKLAEAGDFSGVTILTTKKGEMPNLPY